MKTWYVTSGEIPSNDKLAHVPISSTSSQGQANFSTNNLTFSANRVHNLAGNDLALIGGKIGVGTNTPNSLFHLKGSSTPILTLEMKEKLLVLTQAIKV